MQKKVTSNKPLPSAFRVFRNANGGSAVQNEDNSRGGIFISYEAAIRFVNAGGIYVLNPINSKPTTGNFGSLDPTARPSSRRYSDCRRTGSGKKPRSALAFRRLGRFTEHKIDWRDVNQLVPILDVIMLMLRSVGRLVAVASLMVRNRAASAALFVCSPERRSGRTAGRGRPRAGHDPKAIMFDYR
jgi:hypothetical protein